MADAVKQRLIGALLVLFIIIIAAVILVKNANDNVEGQEKLVLPEQNSTIETVDDNVIVSDQEVLLDPHELGDDVVAVAKGHEIEAISTPTQSTEKATPLQKIAPKVEPVKVVEPVEAAEPIKPKPVDVKKEVVKVIKTVPKTTNGPEWVIQLASFGVKGNAEALQKKVKTLGYQSTIQPIQTSQGKTVYRLNIGPESNRQTVDMIVSKVKQHLRLSPQVIKQ